MGFLGDAIGSITGGFLDGVTGSKKASKKATAAAEQARRENNALALNIFDRTSANFAPSIATGNQAQTSYNALIGLPGSTPKAAAAAQGGFENYLKNFGYASELDQGSRAITGSQAAQGLLGSGSTLKSLQRFGLGLRGQFGSNYLNLLGNQQALGANAAGAMAGVGTNYTGQVTNNNNSAASAIGNAALARSATNTNFLGSALSAAAMASDIRVKRDIVKLGELADGLGIYSFRYIWGVVEHIGVMAQEVARLRPWALGPLINGEIMTVNYGRLDEVPA